MIRGIVRAVGEEELTLAVDPCEIEVAIPEMARRQLQGKVGELVAERAKAAGVESVVFDRGGNRYAGRVAAIADGAREGGLSL